MMPGTTIEQWMVLQTVVEEGSYARAAERLCRSTSSVSYALTLLQDRLGVELLEIVGRKAALTEDGRLMLSQAQPLLAAFRQLESLAAGLREGVRSQISLIVDTAFPKKMLFAALRIFQRAWPGVQVHVDEVLRTETATALARQEAELYITTHRPANEANAVDLLIDIDFVAMAQAHHPLHQLPGPLTAAQLEQYPLVVMTDRTIQRLQMRATRSVWSFTTMEAAIEAVGHGVGYGWLPLHSVGALEQNGILRRLPLAVGQVRKTLLYLVFGEECLQFDPAVMALAESLRHQTRLQWEID